MKFNDLLFTINTVLGTKYTDTDQVSVPELERAIMLVRLNVLLDAKLDVQEGAAPRVVRKFSDLDDGAPFSYPLGGPVYPARYEKDTSQTAQRDCHCCGMARANARSIERAGAPWHFCPDDPVLPLPVKDEPKDSRTLFYKLEPGELFVIPGVRMGTHEKLAVAHQAKGYCPRPRCLAWVNAKKGNDVLVHICPDTVVLPVPF